VTAAVEPSGQGAAWAGREVVVLGGAGFIGSNLALRLSSLGATVTVVDGLIEGCGGNLANLDHAIPRERFLHLDLARQPVPDGLLSVTVVFDLMGDPAHGRSLVNPRRDLECNLLSQIALFEALRKIRRPPLVVLASTRQVYGRAQSLPVSEDHPLAPPDPNGIHKVAAEQYASVYGHVYGVRAILLRLTNVYGPRQGNADPAHGVAGFLIGRLMRGEPVLLYGGGTFRRDWLYVDDAVEALLAAGTRESANGRVFNIGHDRPVSLREFALKARELVGAGEVRDVPFPPEQRVIDVGDYWTDPRRAAEQLGWRASTSLFEGLRATIEFYRSRPGGERWPP